MEINAVKRASLAIFGKKVRIQILRVEAWVPGNIFLQSLGAFYCECMCHRSFCGKMPERCVVYGCSNTTAFFELRD